MQSRPRLKSTVRYRVADTILFRHWEQTVIFHTGSSDTYCLDDLAACLLLSLLHSPASIDELAEQVACQFDVDRPSQLTTAVEHKLNDLLRMDLIDREGA